MTMHHHCCHHHQHPHHHQIMKLDSQGLALIPNIDHHHHHHHIIAHQRAMIMTWNFNLHHLLMTLLADHQVDDIEAEADLQVGHITHRPHHHHHRHLRLDVGLDLDQGLDLLVADIIIITRVVVVLGLDHHHLDVDLTQGLRHHDLTLVIPLLLVSHYQCLIHFNLILSLYLIRI